MKNGYWNGEPATFTVVEYDVTKSEQPLYWNNTHIGHRRQAVKITQGKQTFLIDNQYGDGYYKVTTGMGSPRCGHKSVDNPENVAELPEMFWRTVYDKDGFQAEEFEYEKWQRENFPEEYKRLQSLRQMIVDNRKKYNF